MLIRLTSRFHKVCRLFQVIKSPLNGKFRPTPPIYSQICCFHWNRHAPCSVFWITFNISVSICHITPSLLRAFEYGSQFLWKWCTIINLKTITFLCRLFSSLVEFETNTNISTGLFPDQSRLTSVDNNRSGVNIKMYAVSKLNKQHEQTWINLQKRLNSVQFPYQKLFPNQEVYQFVKNKAISVGSCEGYFIPSLLTTTAFILASNNAQVNTTTHKQPLNIFTIFVGYPGTGKFNLNFFLYPNSLLVTPCSRQDNNFPALLLAFGPVKKRASID